MVVCRNKGYIPRWKNLPLRFCKRPRPIIAFFATMLTAPMPCMFIQSYTTRRIQVVLSRSPVVQCYKQLYYNKKLYYIITFYNCIYCIYTIYQNKKVASNIDATFYISDLICYARGAATLRGPRRLAYNALELARPLDLRSVYRRKNSARLA